MIVTADRFLEQLRGVVSCPHLVVAGGKEEYYRKTIAEVMKKKIAAEFPNEELNLSTFHGKFNLVDLREAINSTSFFGGLNWVMVEDPQFLTREKGDASKGKGKKQSSPKKTPDQELLDLLRQIPENSYVLCLFTEIDKRTSFYKTISKLAPYVECEPLRWFQTKQLNLWLEEEAGRYGSRFDAEARAVISEYVSSTNEIPLLLLKQEVQKLALYAGKRKIWTADDVRQMFSQLPQVYQFAIARAIEERDLTKALQLLSAEKKENKFVVTLSVVNNEIRTMAQVKTMMERGDRQDQIAAQLKKNPYIVKNLMEHSRRYSLQSLEHSLEELALLGIRSRSTNSSERNWARLEEIIVTLIGG